MKYVIVNYSDNETTVFVYETESQEELFRFVNALNKGDRCDEFEIEVWEYPENIDGETIMRLSASKMGEVTYRDLWNHELLGKQLLGRHVDNTDKINVLSEEEKYE